MSSVVGKVLDEFAKKEGRTNWETFKKRLGNWTCFKSSDMENITNKAVALARQDAIRIVQKHYDIAKKIDAKDDMDLLEGIMFELKQELE